MNLAADFAFAKESGEFSGISPLVRYAALINPEATRAEFVAAAVAAGYAANSSANRFREARHTAVEWGNEDGHPVAVQQDGSIKEVTPAIQAV